jgi:hypothetical protein
MSAWDMSLGKTIKPALSRRCANSWQRCVEFIRVSREISWNFGKLQVPVCSSREPDRPFSFNPLISRFWYHRVVAYRRSDSESKELVGSAGRFASRGGSRVLEIKLQRSGKLAPGIVARQVVGQVRIARATCVQQRVVWERIQPAA